MVSNPFTAFQTETATLKKIILDGAQDETVAASYSVNIDPVFGFQRTHSTENEDIRGRSTILTSDTLESDFDLSHRRWKLEYNGHTYNIEEPTPYYTIGTNNLEHIEVTLL